MIFELLAPFFALFYFSSSQSQPANPDAPDAPDAPSKPSDALSKPLDPLWAKFTYVNTKQAILSRKKHINVTRRKPRANQPPDPDLDTYVVPCKDLPETDFAMVIHLPSGGAAIKAYKSGCVIDLVKQRRISDCLDDWCMMVDGSLLSITSPGKPAALIVFNNLALMANEAKQSDMFANRTLGPVISADLHTTLRISTVRTDDGDKKYVLKTVAFRNVNEKEFKSKKVRMAYARAIAIQRSPPNENVLQLVAMWATEDYLYLEYDKAESNVKKLIEPYQGKPVPEELQKSVIGQALNGLSGLHTKKICHGNIKLETLLLMTASANNPKLKLTSFSSSLMFTPSTAKATTIKNSFRTTMGQTTAASGSIAQDLDSVAEIALRLHYGSGINAKMTREALISLIEQAEETGTLWADFITRLFQPDGQRMMAAELCQHPFLEGPTTQTKLPVADLNMLWTEKDEAEFKTDDEKLTADLDELERKDAEALGLRSALDKAIAQANAGTAKFNSTHAKMDFNITDEKERASLEADLDDLQAEQDAEEEARKPAPKKNKGKEKTFAVDDDDEEVKKPKRPRRNPEEDDDDKPKPVVKSALKGKTKPAAKNQGR